jgi:hypothetical protein
MTDIDRRTLLRGVAFGAAAAALGLTITPKAAEATPLAAGTIGAAEAEDLIENVQVVVVPPPRRRRRPRRRRWVCWWHRGRRVCGWRYW